MGPVAFLYHDQLVSWAFLSCILIGIKVGEMIVNVCI